MFSGRASYVFSPNTPRSFSTPTILKYSAIIGGFGWGWFIDEIGKYVTRDNNYWYQPAVIYIYFSFILLYLIYRFAQTRFPPRPLQSHLFLSLSKKATHFKPLFIALSLYSIYYAIDKLLDLSFQPLIHPAFHMVYLKITVDLISSLLIILGWFFIFHTVALPALISFVSPYWPIFFGCRG